jgi:hypothetical protein
MTAVDRFWQEKTLAHDWSHLNAMNRTGSTASPGTATFEESREYPGRLGERPGAVRCGTMATTEERAPPPY